MVMTIVITQNSKCDLNALLKKEAAQERDSRRKKRLAQHKQWMRVMMEGQSTPDLAYQKTDT